MPLKENAAFHYALFAVTLTFFMLRRDAYKKEPILPQPVLVSNQQDSRSNLLESAFRSALRIPFLCFMWAKSLLYQVLQSASASHMRHTSYHIIFTINHRSTDKHVVFLPAFCALFSSYHCFISQLPCSGLILDTEFCGIEYRILAFLLLLLVVLH